MVSDMGEYWKDVKPIMKEISGNKKQKNSENAFRLLDKHEVPYEIKNGGIHLVVDKRIDYYPTTGKWKTRGNGGQGRGIFNLLSYLGIRGASKIEDLETKLKQRDELLREAIDLMIKYHSMYPSDYEGKIEFLNKPEIKQIMEKDNSYDKRFGGKLARATLKGD